MITSRWYFNSGWAVVCLNWSVGLGKERRKRGCERMRERESWTPGSLNPQRD